MKTLDYYMNLPYKMEIIPDRKEGGYVGCYPDLPGCLTCAETIEGVVTALDDAKRAWLSAALEDGITISEPASEKDISVYSGQFRLRMPRSLHMALARGAQNEGVSMNQYCNYLLAMNNAIRQNPSVT
ncbi:MAG: type II toxin-antitoxin system HicB family antitoxin [Lachnospiraceae bacterium]|nr:type II toxin-antitoxin system HicB family antitoxin [Lachnospiraceae bacterium]